ncbi:M56 family metallopeptidase [Algoriphagus namhaensis]|uniref:M56 family metallopeptidase n=1 Tax=Algoriphagus namhaensis TaxID=915353 RepID=A0ABV8ARK2_9BACT
MNLLVDWIPDYLLSALGWTLVHSIWQMILVAGLLWLGLKLFKSKGPAFNYNLSLGALLLTVLLVTVTFVDQVQNETTQATLIANFQPRFQGTNPTSGVETPVYQAIIAQTTDLIESNIPLLVNFWFFGAILFMFRLIANLAAIRNLRQASHPVVDFELEKSFYRLLGKINLPSNIQLRIGRQGTLPMTFGFLKPVVLIPSALIFHLSPQQLEAILAHELAHVKRNDYLINLIQSSLEVLFFYHPCFWWMSQTIKELRENAADDLVVKSGVAPDTLAFALAEVLNFANQPQTELALAAAKKRNPTLQRIKRILGHPAQTYPQNPIISIPMILTLMISLGLVASAGQETPEPRGTVEPLVALQMPEVDIPMSLADTVIRKSSKKTEVIEDKEGKTSKSIIWETDGNRVIELDPDESWEFVTEGDGNVIVINGDTIKTSGKNMFFFNGEGFDIPDVPELDLPEPPTFEGMGVPPFEMQEFMVPIPSMDPADMTPMIFEFDGMDGAFFAMPDTAMTDQEKEAWAKEMEKKSEVWAKKMEERAKKWEKEMAPKMKELEERMKVWQEENEPKMKEFQKKMEEWQKAQEPKMKEFQEKMKAWQEEQQPKIEEFQRKMEVWQKENAAKMEELVEKLQKEAEANQKESKKN